MNVDLDRLFIRDFRAGSHLDSFLVATVTAILGIRFFLSLTGYPQLGGGGLHVAHMLWGGLLMLVALMLLLGFLSHTSRMAAAIIGGLGFGTFVDEIGKFVTQDNDYFFQPAVALIYVTCILFYLGGRALQGHKRYTGPEYLVNALQELQEIATGHLDEVERERARRLLMASGMKTPLVHALLDVLEQAAVIDQPASMLNWLRDRGLLLYRRTVETPGFSTMVVLFFSVQVVLKVSYALALIFLYQLRWEHLLDVQLVGMLLQRFRHLGLIDWLQLLSSFLSGVLVLVGIMYVGRARLVAYVWFRRSILVTIFVTQVFAFYTEQFGALVGLLLNVALLAVLEYLIPMEQRSATGRVSTRAIAA